MSWLRPQEASFLIVQTREPEYVGTKWRMEARECSIMSCCSLESECPSPFPWHALCYALFFKSVMHQPTRNEWQRLNHFLTTKIYKNPFWNVWCVLGNSPSELRGSSNSGILKRAVCILKIPIYCNCIFMSRIRASDFIIRKPGTLCRSNIRRVLNADGHDFV